MSIKRVVLIALTASAVLLAMGSGAPLAGSGMTPREAAGEAAAPGGVSIPYTGSLSDGAGEPVADGAYQFRFALYAAETGGEPLWSEVQAQVAVRAGIFSTVLGATDPIPPGVLGGGTLWLAAEVRGPGEADYTALTPRQRVSATSPAAPSNPNAGAACPHDHVGEVWSANIAWSNGAFKVLNSSNGPSIWGYNSGGGNGVRGYATGNGLGVYGESQNSGGVVGRSTAGPGVEGHSIDGFGLLADSVNSDSIHVGGAGQHALNIESSGAAAILIGSSGGSGVYVDSAGGDGVTVNSAAFDGIGVYSAGDDGVHVRPTIGGVCYRCGWSQTEGFAVLSSGEVRTSAGFGSASHGYAEMVPVGEERVEYEPGDVLVASDSGKGIMVRSSAAFSPAVVGVYAGSAGFVGGKPFDGGGEASVLPLTILGIVPCKVSAENGAIQPGDLLVTSTTPGHAMRADGPPLGTVLGKALEPLGAEQGSGVIQVLVTLR